MIKILHSADWHLDAPLSGHSAGAAEYLRKQLKTIPEKIVKLCKAEQCDLMLLSGDLFDGAAAMDTVRAVQKALKDAEIPVFIAPGNHDFITPDSPYMQEGWSENVHIFRNSRIEDVVVPALDLHIYGAGYTAMDCPGLLKNFQIAGGEKWHIGVLHGEADTAHSPYCPITKEQIRGSGLSYLALGHIHKGSSFRAGDTLCAWPGCPMGHGFDELGTKGVILVQLEEDISAAFIPLDTPRFYDEEVEADGDCTDAVAAILPALPTADFYRITLTGYSAGVDIAALSGAFPHVPNLTLRDDTRPEPDLWNTAGEDSLEGTFFGLLQQLAQSDIETQSSRAKLAARICRQILDGQEVKLP